MDPIRVLLVGDIRLYTEGLSHLLARDGRAAVIAATDEMAALPGLVQGMRPDVILIDMAMCGSLTVVRAARETFADLPLVALAVPDREPDIIGCAEAGVSGFVPREASLDDLVLAMQSAIRGELRCTPKVAMALLKRLAAVAPRPGDQPAPDLTRRELEVLRLMESGLTNKEIARRLGIESSTAKNHVHRVLEKLGVHRRAEAGSRLRRAGPGSLAEPFVNR